MIYGPLRRRNPKAPLAGDIAGYAFACWRVRAAADYWGGYMFSVSALYAVISIIVAIIIIILRG
jgi:hypothetical protein